MKIKILDKENKNSLKEFEVSEKPYSINGDMIYKIANADLKICSNNNRIEFFSSDSEELLKNLKSELLNLGKIHFHNNKYFLSYSRVKYLLLEEIIKY